MPDRISVAPSLNPLRVYVELGDGRIVRAEVVSMRTTVTPDDFAYINMEVILTRDEVMVRDSVAVRGRPIQDELDNPVLRRTIESIRETIAVLHDRMNAVEARTELLRLVPEQEAVDDGVPTGEPDVTSLELVHPSLNNGEPVHLEGYRTEGVDMGSLTEEDVRLMPIHGEWMNVISRQLGITRRPLESDAHLRRRIERALGRV